MLGLSVGRLWLLLVVLCILPPAWAEDVLLIVGDSLSAGYGVSREQAWPGLLERRLEAQKIRVRVVNASISGETSASGRARLPGLLQKHQPRWVLIELGANDGLRGLSLDALEANLQAMQTAVIRAGATPILAGMRIPPNYGPVYAGRFAEVFAEPVAGGLRVPFLLDGVAGQPTLNQEDGIHPNAEGQRRVLENVWQVLQPLFASQRQVEGKKKTVLDSPK